MMLLNNDVKLDFSDVLLVPKRSTLASRKDVVLERTLRIDKIRGANFKGIPIIAANMATGNFKMLKALKEKKCFTAIAKHHNDDWYNLSKEELGDALNYGWYTIGMCEEELDKMIKFRKYLEDFNNYFDYSDRLKICIDIANGYSQKFAAFVGKVRGQFQNQIIMAGNVCTPEMTQELILNGANIVKIGIGPGSACTTRLKTGVGYPQISACIENADVAHGLSAFICLDGGMTCPGDIAKAFAANADFVMLGGMLSGTDECDGDIVTKYLHDGSNEFYQRGTGEHSYVWEPVITQKYFKEWYGMSSDEAPGNKNKNKDYRTSEGRIELVECKGPAEDVINDILGGLRSACTYIGAYELRNMGKCSTLIRVSKQHNRF